MAYTRGPHYKPGDKISKKCKFCEVTHVVICWKQKLTQGWFFKDLDGHRWITSNVCYPCGLRKLQKRKPMDGLTNPNFVKSRSAERLVEQFFIEEGFTVEITKCHGSDLIVSGFGRKLKLEVKTVTKAKNQNNYYVSRVTPLRKKDDYIAIVLPNQDIYLEPMKSHLRKCNSTGKRTVTSMVLNNT